MSPSRSPWGDWVCSAWMGGCAMDALTNGRWGWGILFAVGSVVAGYIAINGWKLEKENAPPSKPG